MMHAGAVVRHNGVMLGAILQFNELVSDLATAFCHGGSNSASPASSDLPWIPKPSDAKPVESKPAEPKPLEAKTSPKSDAPGKDKP